MEAETEVPDSVLGIFTGDEVRVSGAVRTAPQSLKHSIFPPKFLSPDLIVSVTKSGKIPENPQYSTPMQ